jgi:hypothetical protein
VKKKKCSTLSSHSPSKKKKEKREKKLDDEKEEKKKIVLVIPLPRSRAPPLARPTVRARHHCPPHACLLTSATVASAQRKPQLRAREWCFS